MQYYDGLTTTTSAYQYNEFNQLVVAGNKSYLYDDSGNLFRRSEICDWYYGHDGDSRLKYYNLEGGDALVEYVYDSSGRLLLRTDSNGDKRKYYYDGINTLLTREQPDGTETCFRTASAFMLKTASVGQIVGEVSYKYASNNCTQAPSLEFLWYFYDHIGNPVGFTGGPGYLTAINMEAFGTVHQGGQAGMRLTSKEYDPVSNLYYFGARWYDPEEGRWLESEPDGLDGPNSYHFNYNNPIIRYDVDGRLAIAIPAAVGVCECVAFVASAAGAAYATVCMGRALDRAPAVARPKPPPSKPCPPCNPPVGTVRGRYDNVPPSKPHYPHPGDHVHLYQMHQNPNDCQCFWHPIGVVGPGNVPPGTTYF